MKHFTNREIFGVFVAFFVEFLALGSWRIFFDAVLQPDFRNSFLSLVWFGLLGMCFFLGMVVWKTRPLQAIGVVFLFLPSFLFVQTWYHLGFVFLAGILVYISMRAVQEEIIDRVHFHFFRNARAGVFLFVFGLSLALGSLYFSSIQAASWEELVPRFSVGEGTASLLIKTVAYLFPQWKHLGNEGMTVDGFLLSLKTDGEVSNRPLPENVEQQLGGTVTSQALSQYLKQGAFGSDSVETTALSEELVLRTGREQIALLVGRPVGGGEKIADVFSLALQHKIVAALSGEQASQHLSPTIVPVILALLLFITLLPVGSILALFSIGGGLILFRIALFFGWIRLEQVEHKQDVLLP